MANGKLVRPLHFNWLSKVPYVPWTVLRTEYGIRCTSTYPTDEISTEHLRCHPPSSIPHPASSMPNYFPTCCELLNLKGD